MAINLLDENKRKSFGWLCDDAWEIPCQIEALEAWLFENEDKIESGNYAADIGYSPREGAYGGGVILSLRAMSIMVKIGMVLQLSEYPVCEDD